MCARVMVVDDDPTILETVRMILEPAGYDIHIAQGGDKCLEALREGFRGVILMDIMMPGMDGWGTIAAMVKEGLVEGNVICMLTAVHDPGPEMEELKECVLDYVRKPFTCDELLSAVADSICYV